MKINLANQSMAALDYLNKKCLVVFEPEENLQIP